MNPGREGQEEMEHIPIVDNEGSDFFYTGSRERILAVSFKEWRSGRGEEKGGGETGGLTKRETYPPLWAT